MNIKSCLFHGCCTITIILATFLIALQLFFLEGLIRSQAEQGIIMTEDTYNLWGVIPGDTETFTLRNFTMFHFKNAQQFIYQGNVVPEFVQIGGFLYQQKSQFVNYFFTQDDTKVNYDYWLYFDLLPQSKDVNMKYTVINVAPLGFWMQLDSTQITSFTIQGFGGLFLQMSQTIKTQAIGQGVSSTFLQTYDVFYLLCNDLQIENKTCWYLWNDRYYGIDNEVNLQFWVKAAYYNDQLTKQCLFQYFYPIPVNQFEGLLKQISQLSQGVDNILNNWFCPGQQQSCNGYRLTLKQLSSAGVTNNPPPGSQKQQSICSTNSTCIGSPEIVTFLHHEFRQKFKDEKYQSLSFSQQTMKNLLTPYEGLLNIGKLNEIYRVGTQYDKTKQAQLLAKLNEIFKAESNDHAFVIWEWIKYMTNEFVLKLSRGGSRKIAGMGGVFSQAWYQVSYAFADWFLQDTYAYLASTMIPDCKKALDFLPYGTAEKICLQNIPDVKNYKNYYSLIEPCLNLTHFYIFRDKYKINPISMQLYCDIDEQPSNIGLITLQIMQKVFTWYNCTESLPSKKCNQMDILIKQLFNSTITLNPLNISGYPYYGKRSITAKDWNQELPTFEYKQYLKISKTIDPQQHLEYQVRDLFSFDKLLNGPQVQELFMLQNDVQFYHKYHWVNPQHLRNYMRFIVLEVGFGGFTQQRSPKQVFFGYDDPFLKNLKETDTMQGGDPSIQSLIAFNQLNMTKQQAVINKQVMFTGAGDTKDTRQYVSLFNKTFIAVNSTYYDGKQVKWEMVSPWAEEVQLEGSDGFSVPPNLDESQTPPVYISSIARFANVTMKKTLTKFDMQLRDMRISQAALQSQKQNPDNAKYYQGFHCFLNSSYQGFPLFVSKNHFLDADQKWAKLVRIIDENGNKMTANDWDDTRLYIQPYTGTAFSATVYLQSNYYYQADDILFPSYQKIKASRQKVNHTQNQFEKGDQNRMLPIVNTFRSGNISENGVNKYFGDLRDIVNNKRKVALTGWLLIGLCFAIIVGVRVSTLLRKANGLNENQEQKKQQLRPEGGKKRSLLESQALMD